MTNVDEARITAKLHLSPGRMIAVDLEAGRLYGEEEIVDHLAEAHPYDQWLGNMVDLEADIGPGPEPRLYGREELIRRQLAAGLTLEQLELILAPMVEEGKEALGSMGDDTPLAVLSDHYRPLAHFFRQNFSQVTNPPIDALREAGVMSLKTRFKNLGNILAQDEAQTDVYVLQSPVLTTGMYSRILEFIGEKAVKIIDCTMPIPAPEARPGDALRANLDRIRSEAEEAALSGLSQIVLTDQASGPERIALPMVLATGGVHSHLVARGRSDGHARLRRPGRRRGHLRERLPRTGELRRPAGARPVRRADAARRLPELQGGDRGWPAQDHLQDGDQRDLLLSRRL
jgi:glutamate synthase (NADPH/NADH) large chain